MDLEITKTLHFPSEEDSRLNEEKRPYKYFECSVNTDKFPVHSSKSISGFVVGDSMEFTRFNRENTNSIINNPKYLLLKKKAQKDQIKRETRLKKRFKRRHRRARFFGFVKKLFFISAMILLSAPFIYDFDWAVNYSKYLIQIVMTSIH